MKRWNFASFVLAARTEMRSSRRSFLAAAFSCGLAGRAHAQSAPWLLGRWELKYDPDGSPKDMIEFGPSSQVISFGPDGQQTTGVYVWKEGEVRASFALRNGKVLPLVFTPSPDRRQLWLKSARTGKTAIYEKLRF